MSGHSNASSLFSQLVHRLRHTNARYNQIARQCRRTRRTTHHAKRRAHRVGLRIDTSKTCGWSLAGGHVLACSAPLFLAPASGGPTERTTGDPARAPAEGRLPALGLALIALPCAVPSPIAVPRLPEVQVTSSLSHRSTSAFSSSGDGSGSDVPSRYAPPLNSFRGTAPGAPRWRPIPLPEVAAEPAEPDTTSLGIPTSPRRTRNGATSRR